MVKAIDNIKVWAKENVQLITILPENTILKVDTRLKDVLETSVDEKYYLSDEKTALLVSQLENGLAVKEATKQGYALAVEGDAVNFQFPKSQTRRGRVGKQMANTLEASGVNQGVVTKEQCGVEYSRKTGVGKSLEVAHCLSASDWRGLNRNQAQTAVIEVKGCSTRTRSYAGQEEKLEVRKDFVSNSVTTVSKDSMVLNAEIYEQYPVINDRGTIKRRSDGISTAIDANYAKGIDNHGQRTMVASEPYYRIRKLTPLECFRLQSFPDWAFNEAAEVNSNSQLYKQAGNSVTVNVIHEIAKRL